MNIGIDILVLVAVWGIGFLIGKALGYDKGYSDGFDDAY